MAWRSALSKNLQELRIQLCQTGPASQGARDFVLTSYQELKRANPKFPILVRECAGVKPRLIARYDFGKEESVSLDGLDKGAVTKELERLVSIGEKLPRSISVEISQEAGLCSSFLAEAFMKTWLTFMPISLPGYMGKSTAADLEASLKKLHVVC